MWPKYFPNKINVEVFFRILQLCIVVVLDPSNIGTDSGPAVQRLLQARVGKEGNNHPSIYALSIYIYTCIYT